MKRFISTRNNLSCDFYPMTLTSGSASLVPTGVTATKPVCVFLVDPEFGSGQTLEGFAYTLDSTGAPSVTITLGAAGVLKCVVVVGYAR